MKTSALFIFIFSFFTLLNVSAQVINERVSSPKEYAANSQFSSPQAAQLDATFKEQTTGFLHFYIDPKVATNDQYLFKGNLIGGELLDLFTGKYHRYAVMEDTKVYAASAIKGADENLYVVRFVTPGDQRLELFDLINGEMKHIKTLAARKCKMSGCRQLDSYITDIDRDGRPDLVQMSRRIDKNNTSRNEKMKTYKMLPSGELKKMKINIPGVTRNGMDYFDSMK